MDHGYFFRGRQGYGLTRFLGTLCLLSVLVLASGCHSSRTVQEQTAQELQTGITAYTESDTIGTTGESRQVHADSTSIHASGRTVVAIERDTAGRIVRIDATRQEDLKIGKTGASVQGIRFHQSDVSHGTRASATLDSISQKEEKAQKEVDTRVPIECIIGWSIMGALILAYLIDWLYRSWKREGK